MKLEGTKYLGGFMSGNNGLKTLSRDKLPSTLRKQAEEIRGWVEDHTSDTREKVTDAKDHAQSGREEVIRGLTDLAIAAKELATATKDLSDQTIEQASQGMDSAASYLKNKRRKRGLKGFLTRRPVMAMMAAMIAIVMIRRVTR
jgi:hypothetical protein